MPYLHLPVQAGSDRVLQAMNRRHTAADYLRLVERIRAARPDIALSGDFIVGFPGETDADFQATLDLVAAVGYAQAYRFAYSPRPGTPAADRAPVADEVKAERLQRLQALLARQQAAFLAAQVGPRPAGAHREAGAPARADGRTLALPERGAPAGGGGTDRGGGDGAHRRGRAELACGGAQLRARTSSASRSSSGSCSPSASRLSTVLSR